MEYIARPTNRISRFFDRIPVLGAVIQRPLGALGFFIVLAFVLTTIFAPLIAPYSDSKQDFSAIFQPPSASHLLGTDNLGRDLFSRIVFGTRIAMGVALPSVAIGLAFGLILGLSAGYLGGGVDNTIVVLLELDPGLPQPGAGIGDPGGPWPFDDKCHYCHRACPHTRLRPCYSFPGKIRQEQRLHPGRVQPGREYRAYYYHAYPAQYHCTTGHPCLNGLAGCNHL